ncbi:GIY-YIG nuclease family protein [Paenibacillus sp. N3/727]|uniref:GIY-YIG nuclease family protein n=1 Tax=Paenibacillus sp. N3/727 TaxID=2925845 RepID=UPI001F5318D9|nr:GIY-YIG nuclease family protein [Paenibacillus sp. N3/727]UNK21205.1 GIY-YIG nuclease family protein [Paenibacillus sp. N3/727]
MVTEIGYKARTIQIFLPNGSPRGIKIAEITSRIVKTILIPRNRLSDAEQREETKSVGLYLLFGQTDDLKPQVYIGEAENCYLRIKQHNKEKDFWDTAVIITTNNNSFTKSHIKYLEWYCYERCITINRFKLQQTIPTKPYLPEQVIADLMDIFETMKILISTLGYHLFEEARDPNESASAIQTDTYYCKSKGVEALGQFTDEGLVVLKNSQMVLEPAPSMKSYLALRNKLISNGIVKRTASYYIFVSDHVFKSPSAASAVVLGRPSNGWADWKDITGKTLDEIKRG